MRTRLITSSSDPASSIRSSKERRMMSGHQPVLLHGSIDALQIQESDVVLDATLGGAGHSIEMAKRLGRSGTLVGFDLDPDAIARAREALSGAACTVHLVEANFRNLGIELEKLGIAQVSKALFDLGWSSYQLQAGRGFSFQSDEPLVMTYSHPPVGGEKGLTARTIVNTWEEESLADVIYGWGEERYSRRIAKAIVEARTRKPIETARELGEIVKGAVPAAYRRGRLHPATKTFQALRIATNDELGALTDGLTAAWQKLAPGGRIAVITFHSIEDRLVKQLFREWAGAGAGTLVTRKPLAPTREEITENPRSRSAKLRVIEKTNDL